MSQKPSTLELRLKMLDILQGRSPAHFLLNWVNTINLSRAAFQVLAACLNFGSTGCRMPGRPVGIHMRRAGIHMCLNYASRKPAGAQHLRQAETSRRLT